MTAVTDPFAVTVGARRPLAEVNPLAKLAAPLPAMLLLVFTRDLLTPLVFVALAYVIIVAGAPLTRRAVALLAAGVPVAALLIGVGMSLWADPGPLGDSAPLVSVGAWTLYAGALEVGLATGIRLGAIFALALIAGLSTTGADLARAMVQQLRVPYRVGYAALAAFRFVPRFGYELDVIRQAHRVRGAHSGRGPFAAIARWWGYLVPLLAGAIRHAERVALAMDARAFGAHPTRTERHLVPWRRRDTAFVIAFWIVSAVILIALFPWMP